MLLSVPLDYALDLFPQAKRRDPRIVIGDYLPGVAVQDELRKIPWDFLHHVILRIIKCLSVVSKVLIDLASVGTVDLRFFEERELSTEFVLDQLFNV